MSTLQYIRERQSNLSATANRRKKRLRTAKLTSFTLGITGATLAAIAGGLSDATWHPYFAWPAAVSIAAGTFLATRLLGRDQVNQHVRARKASEALKRQAFLYATSSGPYKEGDKLEKLKANVSVIDDNVADLAAIEETVPATDSCPDSEISLDDYLEKRLNNQISYYRRTAKELEVPQSLLAKLEFLLAGIAAVITAIAAGVGKGDFDLASLTAVLTTITGGLLAHSESSKYSELISSYRATANRLHALAMNNFDSERPSDFVEACEKVIESETNSWMALWENENISEISPG